jgi:NADH:ubiquinone oxidoreductase subunit F (NADH-binding)/NADH:ubiquinone oxidoreductase subunit E
MRPHRKRDNPEVVQLARQHGRDPSAILEVLRELQARHGRLAPPVIDAVAHELRLPAERAYGVATFYSLLNVAPAGGMLPVARVCDGPACWLRGAAQARQAAEQAGVPVERSSCLGLCDLAPAALAGLRQCGPLGDAHAAAPPETWPGAVPRYLEPRPGERRVLLARAGKIDPDSFESAREHGAYRALNLALTRAPEDVLTVVEASGLAGRGGAGFPAGRKWRFVAQAPAGPKYVVCNADESEPLVFKDRVLIDNDPHVLLEGMALAGFAVGARHGYIYIRGEYEQQAGRLERAVRAATEAGWLGEHIAGSEFSFEVHVHRGAGAYICGEETALIESLEGKRGEPRLRPPYPTTHGLHGRPTLVNNVETLAAVPAIVVHGAEWYRGLGQPGCTAGTKLYTLLGHVDRPGLFEAPYGLTLRQIIWEFGWGMRPGSRFHLALVGGAAGTIVPEASLDVPLDYASAGHGLPIGAGAILVCDQSVSAGSLLRELLHFFEAESCGKCTPCRVGTREARAILDRLAGGEGQPGDAEALRALAGLMQAASFCGLGQSAGMPILSALDAFPDEFH